LEFCKRYNTLIFSSAYVFLFPREGLTLLQLKVAQYSDVKKALIDIFAEALKKEEEVCLLPSLYLCGGTM
jgi:hypothetical protein